MTTPILVLSKLLFVCSNSKFWSVNVTHLETVLRYSLCCYSCRAENFKTVKKMDLTAASLQWLLFLYVLKSTMNKHFFRRPRLSGSFFRLVPRVQQNINYRYNKSASSRKTGTQQDATRWMSAAKRWKLLELLLTAVNTNVCITHSLGVMYLYILYGYAHTFCV